MGIAFSYVRKMEELGLLGRGIRILDIGSSNLYSASSADIGDFVQRNQPSAVTGLDEFSARLSHGSGYDPVSGGRNEAFIGELFETAGMQYESFDIAAGYKTRIVDLNRAALPAKLRNRFDLVLNFGTTEHILNQLNCFKVIHDATAVGGFIFHSLPAVGYVDHGYITYTGRCFFDVAGYNEYEVLACWFDGPSGGNSLLQSFESYSSHFPALRKALDDLSQTDHGRSLKALKVPDIAINVVYRKVKDKPFWGALESSTSVGAIPDGVVSSYHGPGEGSDVAEQTGVRQVAQEQNLQGGSAAALARMLMPYPALYRAARRIYRAFSPKR